MFPNLSVSRTTCYTAKPRPRHLATIDMLRATDGDTGYSKPSQSCDTSYHTSATQMVQPSGEKC
jgi:hypothetical protein